MAYFANGSEGDYYHHEYCCNCVHGQDEVAMACPVMVLHLLWNYDAIGKNKDTTKEEALNLLWPRDGVHNADCAMFHKAQAMSKEDYQ